MDERLKAQYNSLYNNRDNVFGEGTPASVVCRLGHYLDTGEVLDIGGGEGRNALYLAQQGYAVTVTDFSEVVMEKLAKKACELGLSLRTIVADVTKEKIEGVYDACLIISVLHHFNINEAKALIIMAQKHTKPGGIHMLMTYGNQGDLSERNQNSGRFYPDPVTLRALYKYWEIKELSSKEETTLARDKKGHPMKNDMLTLVAVNIRE